LPYGWQGDIIRSGQERSLREQVGQVSAISKHHEELAEVLQAVQTWLAKHARKPAKGDEPPAVRQLVSRQIIDHPGITVSEASRHLGIAKSHISCIVEELSQRGWVEKRANPQDKRILHLFLSPDGIIRVEENRTAARQAIADVIADLPPEQTVRMVADLQALLSVSQRKLEQKIIDS
jgi:DNA-binding MarR family transcriptional regulator